MVRLLMAMVVLGLGACATPDTTIRQESNEMSCSFADCGVFQRTDGWPRAEARDALMSFRQVLQVRDEAEVPMISCQNQILLTSVEDSSSKVFGGVCLVDKAGKQLFRLMCSDPTGGLSRATLASAVTDGVVTNDTVANFTRSNCAPS